MCSAFHTGAVRLASQKSWLVAAMSSRIESAIAPSGWKGKCARLSTRSFAVNRLTIGFVSPKAWNWTFVAKAPWKSARDAMVTPRCRRL